MLAKDGEDDEQEDREGLRFQRCEEEDKAQEAAQEAHKGSGREEKRVGVTRRGEEDVRDEMWTLFDWRREEGVC